MPPEELPTLAVDELPLRLLTCGLVARNDGQCRDLVPGPHRSDAGFPHRRRAVAEHVADFVGVRSSRVEHLSMRRPHLAALGLGDVIGDRRADHLLPRQPGRGPVDEPDRSLTVHEHD